MTVSLKNPHLTKMKSDYLYHINIRIADTTSTTNLQDQFGYVKIVFRWYQIAHVVISQIFIKIFENRIQRRCNRFSGIRSSLCHIQSGSNIMLFPWVGISSMSVLLHELFKLMKYAKCVDPIFLRLGTSGGIGVPPGTIVISKDTFNGYLKNEYEIAILGERIVRPSKFTEMVYKDLMVCTETLDNFKVLLGNTLAAECFYEGQGRLDGASCSYTEEEKVTFLERCRALGIINIDMEATMFASLTHHLDIKAGELCVNRLQSDQITCSNEETELFVQRLFLILSRYIKKILA